MSRHIDSVIEANRLAGGTFFDKRTVLYFKKKVLPTMYGGVYFISYDLTDEGKRYNVRKVLAGGLICNEGPHATESEAKEAIRMLLDGVVA